MGLLDEIQTPAGQGLLAAAFGGLAAARRGQPLNTMGAAGLAGLQGYQNAQQQQIYDDYRRLQMGALTQQADQARQKNALLTGLLGRFNPQGAPAAETPLPGQNAAPGGTAPAAPAATAPIGDAPALTAGQMPPAARPGLAPSRPGQNFPLSINEIASLGVAGMPGADRLFDLYKYANDGIKREAGNYYINPMNGQAAYMPRVPEGATMTADGRIAALPGAATTNANFKGAETRAVEQAKAGFDFVSVPMPDGSSRMMRRDQAAGILAAPGSAGAIGISQSPANQTYAGETAKASAEQYKQIQNAGMTAPGKIAKYQQLLQLLDGHEGGKLSGVGLEIAQLGNSLGLKIDKNLSNKEASQALTNELALALRNPAGGEGMPGAMSDPDRQFLVASIPNLSQSAEGRRKMVEMQVRVLGRHGDVARMARLWQQRYGRLDAMNPNTGKSFFDNLQEWSDRNPLFPQTQQPAGDVRMSGTEGGW